MDPLVMGHGTRVGDRFELENQILRGGSDVVYRAHDGLRGCPVTLRMLWAAPHSREADNFLKRVQGLAELRHPGIETYVAHGRTPEGLLFIATEWIEGESLRERLLRQPLRVGESLELLRATAAALAAAHHQGMAHGDLGPGRLMLREKRPESVVVTGFGALGCNPAWTSATDSRRIIEVLRYVAPEQARGEVRRSPRADVFALGCVLIECLTGAPPFDGHHAATVLGQLLFEEAPPLGQRYPELPEAMVRLLESMLAKRPENRPGDGEAVTRVLGRIQLGQEQLALVPLPASAAVLTLAEQQLVCLVLGRRPTAARGMVGVENELEQGAKGAPEGMVQEELPTELERFGGTLGAHFQRLGDGSLAAHLRQSEETVTDLAVRAARLALFWRTRMPAWDLALVLGRGTGSGETLVAEALGRAVRLIEAHPARMEDGDRPGPKAGIWLDELMARLLDLHFHVGRADDRRALLTGERLGLDEVRPLLGTVTPCLGREPELGLLLSWIDYSIEEATAQALLVTAPSGTGKSRLRQELVRRLRDREGVAIWIGRGDPMRTGTAYGLLGQAVCELCGIHGHGDIATERARLGERVGCHLPPADRPLVAEFLGELCGFPFPDDESPRLRAARQDPRLMSDQVTSAFVTFLSAECAHKPVLLVLEDLHWSDAATVRLVEMALDRLAEQPLIVLALARPEVKDMFPRLWVERRVQELRLQGLSKKASGELVARVLGARATTETVERLVAQAGGNTLFLEELIRAEAEGQPAEGADERAARPPETVLAMLQARLLRLDPDARRFLRTASLFGDSFWCRGVHALLGEEQGQQNERALAILLDQEVLAFRGEDRATSDRQFAFRHSLLRDAAYGLLTEEDRRIGHRLAAAYLSAAGEQDPMVLAEHHHLGGEPELAVIHLARAAHQALATSDLEGALDRVARGVALGARGEQLGTLRSIEAWARLWQGSFQSAYEATQTALELLSAGSAGWLSVQGAATTLSGFQGDRVRLVEHIELLARTEPLPGAESAFMEPAMMAVAFADSLGMHKLSARFLERMEAVCGRLGRQESRARGLFEFGVFWHRLFTGDVWSYWVFAEAARESFAAAGDRFYLYGTQGHMGVALLLLGEVEQGRALCRESIDLMAQHREPVARRVTQAFYAFALAETGGPGDHAEVRALAEEALRDLLTPSLWTGMTQAALALVEADSGAQEAAEQAARQALQSFASAPVGQFLACALLAENLLGQGRLTEAEVVVREGLAQLQTQEGEGFCDIKLHLVAAQVWRALGQEAAALGALAEAARKLDERAGRIPEGEARQRFLDRSRDRAKLRSLGAP